MKTIDKIIYRDNQKTADLQSNQMPAGIKLKTFKRQQNDNREKARQVAQGREFYNLQSSNEVQKGKG